MADNANMSNLPYIAASITETRNLVAKLRARADSITERCLQGELAKPQYSASGTLAIVVGLQMAANIADERLRELLESQDSELRKEPTP